VDGCGLFEVGIWMLKFILLLFFVFVAFLALSGGEKKLNPTEARALADSRYQSYAKFLGSSSTDVPQPEIEYRESDTLFKYIEPISKKEIIVIVIKNGGFADTISSP
jgi:hypothetical protein